MMADSGAGLVPGLNLHHVGYVLPELGPTIEMYRDRFGYRVVTGPIHDPLQTALVQFLQLAGDASYLEFVAPDGPASKLTVEAAKGRPLHHLCFLSGPLEQTIAHLRSQKMLLISEPRPAVAFDGRRICWLMGADRLPVELIERRTEDDRAEPGQQQ